ncbi:MAG TPA: amino acid permease [Paenibacillus sp.]|jgi:APA family basic amino acid/polyamine antiporter
MKINEFLVMAGIICAFCALCYAEFASMVPVSGSAYMYSYATFGELIAWILGWDLILEYGFAASMVASSWPGYFQGLLSGFGLNIPPALSSAFHPAGGTYIDLPAVLIVLLLTFIVSRGGKESTRLNSIMPLGIIWSLVICSLLYIIVTAVLTGIVPYTQLNVKNPVAYALQAIHQDWVAGFISLGAIVGITTVLFVLLFGQSRLLFAIGRDGLLPERLSRLNPKTEAPSTSIWSTGIIVALFPGLIPLNRLVDLVSIGTLFAFIAVLLGIIILRRTHPELQRSFKVPLVPVIPLIAILSCGYLLISLPGITWIAFMIWMVIGLSVYSLYGYKHSKLSGQTTVKKQK